MTDESEWTKLHDGAAYKVYDTGGLLFRYTVAGPRGQVVTVTSTRWGARRAIAKDKRRQAEDGFWQKPLVEEVPKTP